MKVILTRDVPKLGRDGEVVAVADGYARNYLFPRQLAVVAKGAAMKQHEARIQRESSKTATMLTVAQDSSERLRDQQFQIIAKASAKSTRLFGAVTEADVAEAIKQKLELEIDKRKISHFDPIKQTGMYELSARLHPEVVVPFTIEVVTQEQLDARERARIAAEEKVARDAARAAEATAAAAAAAAASEAAAAARAAAEEAAAEEAAPDAEAELVEQPAGA
jgi:large subunit ribosomal protein L9